MAYRKEIAWQATWKRSLISLFSFLIILLLLTACSSSDDTEGTEKKQAMLTVYVYSPEHPLLIRSEVREVNSTFEESKVNKLQIWIFESETGALVGCLETEEGETALLNVSEGAVYQLPVTDDFVQRKPKVDVYVLANVTDSNCGVSLNKNSSRADINTAYLNENYFGLDPLALVTSVPAAGLPMSGVLKNQDVVGEAPVLRVGTSSIATVKVTRAVSKVRFVFANTKGEPELKIKKITLDAGVHPTSEYLIPRTATLLYNPTEAILWSGNVTAVEIDDPTIYIYGGQEAQVYENLIDHSGLTTKGPFYLRESDKKLKGMITYQIGESGDQTRIFEMDAAGDFRRNHTWIVYAYHAGGGFLQLETLYIKDWTTKEKSHEVYNW